jgi:hypothetical protein
MSSWLNVKAYRTYTMVKDQNSTKQQDRYIEPGEVRFLRECYEL